MIKIACCDDEAEVLDYLTILVDQYQQEHDYEICFTTYQSPFELMSGIERGASWDILLLDVMMPGINGIELAREIRSWDKAVNIIFLTSSPEFAVQSYAVEAYFYQLKPVKAEQFFIILDRAIDNCRKNPTEKLVIKSKNGMVAIVIEQLEYCEVIGHNLLFHLHNGRMIESVGKLNDLEEKLLSYHCFLRVHRSYLVNMAYIHGISYRNVTMHSLTEIPIPHGKYNELKKRYLEYAFEKEKIML